ncbi:uncharacterized protein LOC120335676 isoform X1 [Styela clava]
MILLALSSYFAVEESSLATRNHGEISSPTNTQSDGELKKVADPSKSRISNERTPLKISVPKHTSVNSEEQKLQSNENITKVEDAQGAMPVKRPMQAASLPQLIIGRIGKMFQR